MFDMPHALRRLRGLRRVGSNTNNTILSDYGGGAAVATVRGGAREGGRTVLTVTEGEAETDNPL